MNTFFISDMHLGSKNIIGYCDRPFSSVEEMDEGIIENWNSVVNRGDRVFLLGDNFWSTKEEYYLSRLKGQKYCIKGNHDNRQRYKKLLIDGYIQSFKEQEGVTIDDKYIFMCHYPMRSWNGCFHRSWHLFGHCHNRLCDYGLSTDIGVDKWGFRPVEFEEVRNYMLAKGEPFQDDSGRNFTVPTFEEDKDNFIKHFQVKYAERIEKEAKLLEEML